jgi:hypothetical protein
LPSASHIYFRPFARQSTTYTYSTGSLSFYTEPATPPSVVTFPAVGETSMSISWTASAEPGASSIVIVSEADTIAPPVDGTEYTPNTVFASGGTTAAGDYVVHASNGNSVSISGLTADTLYYVAVYSYSGTGTGTAGTRYLDSAATSSTTTVFNISQPTNLWIHNIGSTSMTLYWTAGLGDGSIVLMKQGSAVDANPSDPTVYAADSVFGDGDQIGTGNYVVYRGNGSSVHVTGLTQGQTYHVAAFTYTGSGLSTEYLLPSPAIASQITSENTPHNVAILNVDDTVTCTTGCHGGHGSALVPRGTAQETACFSCHNPDSGVPGASALTNYSLHTNTKDSPPSPLGSPGEVDCGSCHELHNPGGNNTTYTQHPITALWDYNLHYLRANPDKYVSTALTSPLVMHSAADAAFEAGAAYQGTCQICHTQTPTGYQNTSAGNDIHQGGDLGDVNCMGCHDHGGGFAGGGGDCTGCHDKEQDLAVDSDRPRRDIMLEFPGGDPDFVTTHLTPTVDAADCEVCHDQSSHQGGQVKLFDPDGGSSITLSAYADPIDPGGSADAALLTDFCLGCHDTNGSTPFSTPGQTVDVSAQWTSASHNANGSVSCLGDGEFGCHSSGHGSKKLTLLAPHDVPPTPPANTEEQEGFCFNCHDGSTATTDIETLFTGGTNYQVTSLSSAVVNQRHDVLYDDQQNYSNAFVECNTCHSPHEDSNAEPVQDVDTGASLPPYNYTNTAYNSGGDQDPTNPLGSTGNPAQPDYIQFCNACHDGDTTGTGATMTAGMLDIASAYASDQHGKVGSAGGSGNGFLKFPWRAANANCSSGSWNGSTWTDGIWTDCPELTVDYAALNCTTCHGAHGSDNIFNLRSSITVAGVQMTVGGWSGDTLGTPNSANMSADHTVYTMPLTGGVQVDHDWGTWCSFCHQLEGHNKSETTGCTSSHMHGGKF